jgi:hypothetical protein
MTEFAGRTAVVTGGGSGMGREPSCGTRADQRASCPLLTAATTCTQTTPATRPWRTR